MKKFLFGGAALLILANCSGNKTSVDNPDDTIQVYDSATVDQSDTTAAAEQTVEVPSLDTGAPAAPAAEEEAKKSIKPFTVKNFMEQKSGGYYLRSLGKIKSVLTEGGYEFVKNGSKRIANFKAKTYIYKDAEGNTVTVAAISDKDSGIKDDVNEIAFEFTSSAARNKFNSSKQGMYGAHDQVKVKESGNTVILEDDCFYCE